MRHITATDTEHPALALARTLDATPGYADSQLVGRMDGANSMHIDPTRNYGTARGPMGAAYTELRIDCIEENVPGLLRVRRIVYQRRRLRRGYRH